MQCCFASLSPRRGRSFFVDLGNSLQRESWGGEDAPVPAAARVGDAGQGESVPLALAGASAQPYLQRGKINGSQLSKADYFIIVVIGAYN